MPDLPDEPDTNEPIPTPSDDTGVMSGNDPEPGEVTSDAPAGVPIDAPRLTPQGRTGDEADSEDETDPMGGVRQGQSDKAEG